MSILRLIYLGLATWGAVQPTFLFARWLQINGADAQAMFAAWQVNLANDGLLWGLTISAIALFVFVIAEVSVRRNWSALIVLPVTFLVGINCGLPLYLFLRTRPVA
jgi:uncharacterized protein DUF2834